jgi:eukaryotic-like serine/threonine-protein kinase
MDAHVTGKKLGRYDILEEIGRGGMAVVYRGFDPQLNRQVALKILHPHLVTHHEARERFEREALSIARLRHPSIVEVYDYAGSANGDVYIVMELIEGITLRSLLESREGKPFLPETAALILRSIFSALQTAHEAGIVHRDVKPENILIDSRGSVRLTDFGIAYLGGMGQMTTTGQILGSPAYMSPEHIESPVVDARSDIFSVGILLYEMTTGHPPFVGNNPHQIIKRVVEGYYDNPLLVNPAIGHDMAAIIVRCLHPNPDLRYPSAAEAITALEALLRHASVTDMEQTLQRCLNNPDDWEQQMTPLIIAATLDLGKIARQQRRLPEAMTHLNRVLAMDPHNETALSIVQMLSRKRRIQRNIKRIRTVLLLATMIAGVIWILVHLAGLSTPAEPSSPPQSAFPDTPAPSETSLPEPIRQPAVASPNPSPSPQNDATTTLKPPGPTLPDRLPASAKRPFRSGTPADGAKPRTVIFVPHPMSVDIIINGTDRFTYKSTDHSRLLPPGHHRVEFIPADNRLQSQIVTFHLTESETPYRIGARLQWKPAILKVNSNVDTRVVVNGRDVGRTNQQIDLEMKSGPKDSIRIDVSASGYRPMQQQVQIFSGKTTDLDFQLHKDAVPL